MSNISSTSTLEPWKRTLRTVIAVAVAVASATPWIIGVIQRSIDPSDGLTLILGQVTAVAAAVTRFASSPAGNWLFGLIGLDAAAVQKTQSDVSQTTAAVDPVVAPVAAAVKSPSTDSVLGAADAVVAAAPAVKADAETVVADVKTVAYGQESPEPISNAGIK